MAPIRGECFVCQSYTASLAVHLPRHLPLSGDHYDTAVSLGLKFCTLCSSTFDSAPGLRSHMSRAHHQPSEHVSAHSRPAKRVAPLAPTPPTPPTPPAPLAPPAPPLSWQFLDLAEVPPPPPILPISIVRHVIKCLDRTCAAYIDDPSEQNLYYIISLVKGCIAPALAEGGAKLCIQRLQAWPQAPPRAACPAPSDSQRSDNRQTAIKQIELGHISAAMRTLTGKSKIAPLTEDVIAKLKEKNPPGVPNPFRYENQGIAPPPTPEIGDLKQILFQYPTDTGCGISGWSVPILRLAAKSEHFMLFLQTYTGQMLVGTAPGRYWMTTARLTPFLKDDNGIRPIASGELILRLCERAILLKAFKPEMLAANQFGVGSKGGTESVCYAVELALGDKLHQIFGQFTELDIINAFNALCRMLLADAIRQFCPSLLAVAYWLYDHTSYLIVKDQAGPSIRMHSAQGVRQGDPLAALFFCIAIRPILGDLQQKLGPDHLVLSYVDNIYILSAEHIDPVPMAQEHLEQTPCLKLNLAKTRSRSFPDIRAHGIDILGSHIGPKESRTTFLSHRAIELASDISVLRLIPHQHALLCLRLSIQQRLRHLLRSMSSDDMIPIWTQIDSLIISEFSRIRSHSGAVSPHDRTLITLPLRYGGCGILSHVDTMLPARQAAINLACLTLAPLLPSVEVPEDWLSQRQLSDEVHKSNHLSLHAILCPKGKAILMESQATLARRALSAIPSHPLLRLSDFEIMGVLQHRNTDSLQPPHYAANATDQILCCISKFATVRGGSSIPNAMTV